MMKEINSITTEIVDIYQENLNIGESFMDFAGRFADTPGTVVLMSGGNLDSARYHLLAARPWLTVSARGNKISIDSGGESFVFNADPFETLRRILNRYSMPGLKTSAPVCSGIFGYLAYDLKDRLEVLPKTSVDDLKLPDLVFFAPSILAVEDKKAQKTTLFIPDRVESGKSTLEDDLEAFHKALERSPAGEGGFSGDIHGLRSNFEHGEYMEAIAAIKEYIASGHVYQVNMSQRFQTRFSGCPFSLFKTLFSRNPAPFFAYIHAGDHQIVSTSPERFIARNKDRVEARPIKGTRPRGRNEKEDAGLRKELFESPKDDAELSMIVDLLRNDIGKACRAGSVRVADHKRVEAYTNVYHLVSVVEGILDTGRDSIDLIQAAFPGGSITGCPKIRSMEIIDELEPDRRHIYTGSIGYISFHDTLDLSIAIRTASISRGMINFSVGGGIVYDSDPNDEFEETLHKGKTLMEAFSGDAETRRASAVIWLNGKLTPAGKAMVPLASFGFQYGCGIFETIRVNQGEIRFFEAHEKRFNRSWRELFSSPPPDQSWSVIIERVVRENGLDDTVAAVKMIGARGVRTEPPFDEILAVTARPYTDRTAGRPEPGLHLAVYPHPRQTPLADFKTLNYFYYQRAEAWAAENRADTALILNPDGAISETGIANVFLVSGESVVIPESPHVLPGVTLAAVIKIVSEWGYDVSVKPVFPDDLFHADMTAVANSLMGTVPALSLDGKALPRNSNLCARINEIIL